MIKKLTNWYVTGFFLHLILFSECLWRLQTLILCLISFQYVILITRSTSVNALSIFVNLPNYKIKYIIFKKNSSPKNAALGFSPVTPAENYLRGGKINFTSDIYIIEGLVVARREFPRKMCFEIVEFKLSNRRHSLGTARMATNFVSDKKWIIKKIIMP